MDTATCELTRIAETGASARQKLDKALLAQVAAGDRLAMQVLFQRHNVRIYRFVLRLVGNPAIAEEIVGDVFLIVWQRAASFQSRCEVTTWLLTIARHKAISLLRRRSEAPLTDEMVEVAEDPAANAETLLEQEDRRKRMRACLAQLSPLHREVIDLVYYHEKSIEEVAQIVEAPIGTVKTRVFYARNHLAKLIKATGGI
jgi:RNA polymerase sigma-70 factor (ECF subfamily)